MKIRTDFVTNSSSSSYICVAKVDADNPKFIEYMKEEYGRFGVKLMDDYLVKGADILSNSYWYYDEFKEFMTDEDGNIDIDPDSTYLQAKFEIYSDEGSIEGNDAFFYRAIPEKYMNEVYIGE